MSDMNKKPPIRVIVIDDSHFIRQTFSTALNSDPAIEVVATAADPYQARELIKQHHPDVITLDIEMPKMDGISFLEKIMRLRPMPVVMASTLTAKGADITVRALEIGAVDYVAKPAHGSEGAWDATLQELIGKVKAAAKVSFHTHLSDKSAMKKPPQEVGTFDERCIVGIGASTGGVEAIGDLLAMLPPAMPPIVITQHMPALFTASFARRLNDQYPLNVVEAKHQQKLQSGCVYIAPGSQHLRVHYQVASQSYWARLDKGAPVSNHCPSVDVLFESLAEQAGPYATGAILTGMGQDGAAGLLKMRQAGAMTIGQNQATCTVYGMPRAAQVKGAVMQEMGLHDIAGAIIHSCGESAHGRIAHA